MRARLTDELLARARCGPNRKQAVLWDAEVVGFGVVLGARTKTFFIDWREAGIRKRRTLGHLGQIDTETARARAREAVGSWHGDVRHKLARAEQRLAYALRDYVRAFARVRLHEMHLAAGKHPAARPATRGMRAGSL